MPRYIQRLSSICARTYIFGGEDGKIFSHSPNFHAFFQRATTLGLKKKKYGDRAISEKRKFFLLFVTNLTPYHYEVKCGILMTQY